METQVHGLSQSQQQFLDAFVRRLNASHRCIDALNEIVRACKEVEGFASLRLWVLQNKSRNSVFFSSTLEELREINLSRRDLVVLHECSMMHIPLLLGNMMLADEVCDLCDFIASKGGDVNADASQKIPTRGKEGADGPWEIVCEQNNKKPIFYAVDKKCVQMVRKLIDLGADCSSVMYDAYSRSENITPLIYAMSEAIKLYEREDGFFEIIDLLLAQVGVDSFLETVKGDKASRDVVIGFVSLVGLDLEIYPGEPMEAVKGEHLNIIELLLKCTRMFGGELSSVKRSQGYKNMFSGRLFGKRGASAKAIPLGSLPLSTRFRRYVESLPEMAYSSFVGKNVIFSTDIGDLESQILALAAYSGQVEVMKWLLEHEVIDVNKANGYGFTALHFAASVNCVPAVEMLLDAGADMEAKRAPYATAAHIAALNASLDVLVCMHRKRPLALLCVDGDGQSILHYAASSANDNTGVVQFILENVKGISPDASADIERGQVLLINSFAKEVIKKKRDRVTSEDIANIVECVRERGFETKGSTALYIAVESKNLNIAKYLIEQAGCNPNINGPSGCTALNLYTEAGTLLHMAVRAKDLNFVKKLLTYKELDLSIRHHGHTAMDLAILNRDRLMIATLLEDPRQSLATELGYRKVPYSKILSSKGLLDYRGKKILISRVNRGVSSSNAMLAASGIFCIFAIVFTALAIGLNSVLQCCGLNSTMSLESRTLVALAGIILLLVAYVVYVGVRISKEDDKRNNARFYLSTSHVKRSKPRRYMSDSSGSRYSSDGVCSAGSSTSGGTILNDQESLDEYLADDSSPSHRERGCRRHKDFRRGAESRTGLGRETSAYAIELGREAVCSSSNSESTTPSSAIGHCGVYDGIKPVYVRASSSLSSSVAK
ncbi:ankyrin repeat domain-containing protein [Anaplasma phagocytophilum]|uniref:Ankyrin repeat family protein n=2 Tax=Anaplasma phagocytophilum TaxID=948 RepID=A0A0F3N7T3_ANAPH|nr:ankyrin repeat domain-containing protein [Anaplasma phagocytophilum]KJZ99084.1 ankyrin repeat family protein [Anaplasma phagocytophilum str. CR1007]AGR79563.1 hypothetical protein YYU_04250 [Anaplasma phagocytophilum str. HZ2]AGR80817.1 hypothetical protein WSQ_04275 [Anaplasma phagocytophilum str. JM]AGR82070.1 hypothetical protein YYY_04270 [Anaplasma phagocytophilum str. Dog2]EOA61178.1 ankyrin repeat-containing protein [Anaplasma phagocytophilum str. HGE1]